MNKINRKLGREDEDWCNYRKSVNKELTEWLHFWYFVCLPEERKDRVGELGIGDFVRILKNIEEIEGFSHGFSFQIERK